MRVHENSITYQSSRGHLSLHIPAIGYPAPSTIEMPDEWFMVLKHNRIVCGKEEGFLFLSRVGFEANKGELKKAWETSQQRGNTWEQYEQYAEMFFVNVKLKSQKFVDRMAKKLSAAQASLEKLNAIT